MAATANNDSQLVVMIVMVTVMTAKLMKTMVVAANSGGADNDKSNNTSKNDYDNRCGDHNEMFAIGVGNYSDGNGREGGRNINNSSVRWYSAVGA